MASKIGLLLGANIIFTVASLFASTNSLPISTSNMTDASSALSVALMTNDVTHISLDGSQLQFSEAIEDFESYTIPTLTGEGMIMENGKPSLPRVTRLYRIPNTGGVDLMIENADFEIVENFKAYPFHDELHGFDYDARDHSVYSRDEWFPSEVATISAPMVFRDFRVVEVTLYPVQINPVTRQARVYSNINVNVVPNSEPGFNEILNPRRPSGAFANAYRTMIANLDDHALDDATTTPGTLLILSRDNANLNQWVDTLATWKRRKGFDVTVNRYTNAPSAATMINYIRNFDPLPEFVCIVGDPASNSFGLPTDGSNYDHSFALENTTDELEDIGVGRLSIESVLDMQKIVAKILGYERNPWMTDTDWFTKAFLYACVSMEAASNYTTLQWGGQQLQIHTGIDNINLQTHTSNQVNENLIRNELADGVGMFIWRGIWIGGMSSGLAETCLSGWRLPVCFSVTCATGDFDWGLSVSESWLLAGTATSPEGGICGMGMATSGTHHPENICVTGGLFYSFANSQMEHLGPSVSSAKAWLTKTFGAGSSSEENFCRWFNLMGDPSLSMWSDVPVVIDADHSAALNVGARRISVHVQDESNNQPIQDALVVALKGEETVAKGLTDANGDVELPIEVETAGTLMLTVTKRNHKAYLADIPCTQAGLMVTSESYTVDDDGAGGTSGNSDGIINPGEIVDLNITLKNHGNATTGTGISAVLASASPRLTVINANSTYPDLAPGAQAAGASAFRVEISDNMQQHETGLLNLTVTASSVQTVSAIPITSTAGEVQYISQQFVGGAFGPGITRDFRVTIKNIGDISLNGTTATLISQSPFVSVDDNSAVYGDIAPNAQATNTTDAFTLRANSLTFGGHQAPMSFILQTSGGFHDTTHFVVSVGTALDSDPTGPDAYGYYAYDNTDIDYELHPEYSYVNISGGMGTNLNINDSGEKTSTSTVWSTVRALPFPFTYYGVTYDTVTICANGWIAFGDQGWNDNFRNYPIPAQNAPAAMVAPYWDDLKTSGTGKGVWMYYDEAEHRFIVQWKAGAGGSFSTNLDFEVILLDEQEYPTLDDNGTLIFQYSDVQMNLTNGASPSEASGSTVGIQDPGGTMGLNYAFKTEYLPGAADVVDSRAILITTDARALFGIVQGYVTDEETGSPMQDATVSIDGYNYQGITDATGFYQIPDVLIGEYTVRSHKTGYNDATVPNVIVELDSTETVNFSMLHPEIALSRDSIVEAIVDGPTLETSFNIINDGNGPLDYSMEIVYTGGGEPVDPWGPIEDVNVSDLTGDLQILGCEFANNRWYVSGAGGLTGTNYLYIFDREGTYLGTIPQPTTDPIGWFDLAWDGEYIYGSEQGSEVIRGIDLQGTVQATIPCPYLNPARAIAYDEVTDHFWVADMTSDIFEIDRQGNLISTIENTADLQITGLAWNETDPEDFKLYAFSINGSGNQTTVTRIHPVAHIQQTVTVLEGEAGDRAGGCAMTGGWNSALLVFGAILQNPSGDRLGIYQVDFNTTWITVTPMISSVEGGQSREVSVSLDATELMPAVYQVSILIYNDVLDVTVELPVEVTVIYSDVPEDGATQLPAEYALHQNYPNPFNPSTTISYDLKASGHTKLTVYNVVGQEVVTLIDRMQEAGQHIVHFNATGIPSGVYFYRLTSGDFTKTAKMVLMK